MVIADCTQILLRPVVKMGQLDRRSNFENENQHHHASFNPEIRRFRLKHGYASDISPKLKSFIDNCVELCQPSNVHICDGSEREYKDLIELMVKNRTLQNVPKYENCWLARTNPKDVARVESKTFICTEQKSETVPDTKPGVKGTLGNWISPEHYDEAILERFPGCMKGRTMYVIPFSMGPMGSPLSKIGVEITDSPYVVGSMRIMTRIGTSVLNQLDSDQTFVKALHSVGTPVSGKHDYPEWPCDPERTIILHQPAANEIVSYGSGYGGNSLLGKKCFALRIGSTIAKREGWLAEHMLILGITNPTGQKIYIAAAFPSACGKTNMAMLCPTLPGYKVQCVGDDIAWMTFDKEGVLRAINPENGFFGVAPGTSTKTNPMAMQTVFKNTIFTNVASTSDGGVYWEGMEEEVSSDVSITDWHNKPWTRSSGTPAAHPNSRFCTPAVQCPSLDPDWESPEGVPISAIIFGGRRPTGVPLVYESFNWQHGVFIGAAMKSEATAAAEHQGKEIMHDPFAMRPFFGYNFGDYLKHWLSMERRTKAQLPKIFHVNWFRKGSQGEFLWPGFGENIRVLDWIMRRVEGNKDIARVSPIGYLPKTDAFITTNLADDIDLDQLLSVDKSFWEKEVTELQKYLHEQLGSDMPTAIQAEIDALKQRISQS